MGEIEDLSEWEVQPTKKMVGYGFGYIIVNYLLLYGLAQMDFFYRNVIGLPADLILWAGIIFAIWNMINDPFLGYLTDRPLKWTKKSGLRKPWVILSTLPMFLFFILIWTAPPEADNLTKFAYMLIMVCVFDTFFSIYNDHIYGGYTNQFLTKFERRKSFMLMTVMLFVILIILQVVQSIILGEGETIQLPYIVNSIVMVGFLIVFSYPTFKAVTESEEMKTMFIEKYETAEKASFWKVLRTALKTKNFNISLLGYTVQTTAITLWNAAQIYFFVDVYGLSFAESRIPLLLSVLTAIGSIPFWSNYTRRGSFKRTYWVSFLLHGLTFLPFMFMILVADPMFIPLHTIFLLIMNVFFAGEITMLMPVASDTYDEVALKLGKRADATFVGIRNFFFRVAFLIQALVFWLVLAILTDYQEGLGLLGDQSLGAKFGILVMGALIPCILLIVMSQIFRKHFTLVGKEKDELVKGLKEAGLFIA